jgi:translocation and assembly module TamB
VSATSRVLSQVAARRGWLQLLMSFLLLVGLSGGLVAWAESEHSEDRLRRLLVSECSRLLGEDLYVQRLHIEQVVPLKISLHGVTVHSRHSTHGGQPLLRVERIDMRFGNPLDLLRRRLDVESVIITRPSLRIAVEDGKLRDFAGLSELLSRPRQQGAVQVWLGALQVVGAAANVTMSPPGLGTVLTGLDLEFRQDRSGTGHGRLAVGGIELIAGSLREQGQLRAGTFTVDQGVVNLDGYELDMSSGRIGLSGLIVLPQMGEPFSYSLAADARIHLARLRDAWPRLPELEGEVDARVRAVGEGLDPRLSFSVQARDARVHVVKRRALTFEMGAPSLIGYYEAGVVVLEKESTIAWGGGQIAVGGRISLAGDMPWEVSLDVRDVKLEQVLDSLSVKGSWVAFTANGTAQLSGTLRGGFQGTGQLLADVGELYVWDSAWDGETPGDQILHVPSLHLDSGVVLSTRSCLFSGATVTVAGSTLHADAEMIFSAPVGLDVVFQSQSFDAAAIENNVAGLHIEGRGGVQGRIVGQAPHIDVSGSLELEDFVLGKWPFGRASGDVHWHSREALEFTGLRGQRGASDYEAEVRLLFADVRRGGDRERMELAIEAKVPRGHARAEDLLPIFFGDAVPLSGSVWGEASLSGRPAALNGAAVASGEGLSFLWEEFESLDVRAQVRDGGITFEEGWARKASGNALFARGTITADREVDVEFRLPRMGLDELATVQKAFPLSRAREGEMPEAALALLAGQISGNAVLTGTLDDLEVVGDLRVEDTVYRGTKLGDSGLSLAINEHQLRASGQMLGGQIIAAADMQLRGVWPYRFTIDSPELTLDPFLPRTVLARREPVSARAGGTLQGQGTLRDGYHDVALQLDRLELERGGHLMHARGGQQVLISYRDGAFRFERLELVGPDQRTDLRIGGWLRPSGPLAVSVSGQLDAAFLDLAYDIFHRVEADALHLDLDISGMSTSAVEIEGVAELRDALVKTIYFPHAVDVEYARFKLRDRRLSLEEFRGGVGGGRIEGVEGSHIILDQTGYRPRRFALKARCLDCTIQYPEFMPPIRGDVELQFRGLAPGELVLSGRIHVAEMVLREPLNWTRSVFTFRQSATESLAAAQGAALFALDLDVESEPESLRIDNNLGDLWGTADKLHIGGDTNHVLLTGAVRIDGGRLPLKGREFDLDPGVARFGLGGTWLPEVDVSMWTDVATSDETHRISYSITGPLDSPQLTATASPYLSEADINSILLLGLTQEQLENANVAEVLAAAGGASLGTLGETAATSFRATVEGGRRGGLPDRLQIVPVYSEATGSTTLWAFLSKEVVPDLLWLEGGLGYSAGARTVDTVGRLQLRFLRNLYLEASWLRDERATTDYGNFGLDVKLELDFD